MAQRVEDLVVEGWFSDPPPLVAAMASRPTIGVVRAFVEQWTKFSRLFPRWVGAIIANCPDPTVVAYEIENLASEVLGERAGSPAHYELLLRLGEGVGLERDQIEAAPILPEASAAFDWLWAQARHPDWLVGFTAVNGLEILGDRGLPASRDISAGTGLAPEPYSRSLGLGASSLEFFEVSDEADAGHGRETVAIIAAHTPAHRQEAILGVLQEAMLRLRGMMGAMWDMAACIDERVARDGADGRR